MGTTRVGAVIRFFVVAGPWVMLDLLFMFENLASNIVVNKMWAGGNWLLMFDTFVEVFQGFCSFFLVAEFPSYLQEGRPIRAFSYGLAAFYSVVYLYMLAELFFSVWTADESYTVVQLMIDLFLAFNVICSFSVFFTNAVIVYKEIRLEFAPDQRIGWPANEGTDVSLGL